MSCRWQVIYSDEEGWSMPLADPGVPAGQKTSRRPSFLGPGPSTLPSLLEQCKQFIVTELRAWDALGEGLMSWSTVSPFFCLLYFCYAC